MESPAMAFLITDEQKKQIRSYAEQASQKMSWEIADYIEKELIKALEYNPDRNTAEFAAGVSKIVREADAQNQAGDTYVPVEQVTQVDQMTIDNDQLGGSGMQENNSTEFQETTQVKEDFSQMTPQFNQVPDFAMPEATPTPPQPPINGASAGEVAPSAASNEPIFGAINNGASFDGLDGSDLNYSPAVEAPAHAPEFGDQFNAIPTGEFINPQGEQIVTDAQIVDSTTVPELDLPIPESVPQPATTNYSEPTIESDTLAYTPPTPEQAGEISATANIELPPVGAPAGSNQPVEINQVADDQGFPQARGILGKVLSKGWGKKTDQNNA